MRDVIFPAVGGEHVLHELVKEYQATRLVYRRKLHQAMRSSYQAHYRRLFRLRASKELPGELSARH